MSAQDAEETLTSIIHILDRRLQERGYLTRKDERLLLGACSWFCGFPVTMKQLKKAIDLVADRRASPV